jgi:Fe2+ transport system protein FeoA
MNLAEVPLGEWVEITTVGGDRSFRRRLLELGLLPGCKVRVLRVAPLGDPLELVARGANLSIRAQEARQILVEPTSDARVSASPVANS